MVDMFHCGSLKQTDKLYEIYRQRYSGQGVELLELKTGYTTDGLFFASVVGVESLDAKPTAFFGSFTIFSTPQTPGSGTIEFLLWSQEDKRDVGIREQYFRKEAEQSSVTDPYSRIYDDVFVFHALSRLRRTLNGIPKQVKVLI